MEPLRAIQHADMSDGKRYITPDVTDEVFPRGFKGVLPVAIRELPGLGELWLVDRVYGRLIPSGNRGTARNGCHVVNVRGWDKYPKAHEDLKVVPGESLRLIREPGNPFDANAIAVCVYGDDRILGYVNKGLARQLARRIDGGLELECLALRAPAVSNIFTVVICSKEILEQALR